MPFGTTMKTLDFLETFSFVLVSKRKDMIPRMRKSDEPAMWKT